MQHKPQQVPDEFLGLTSLTQEIWHALKIKYQAREEINPLLVKSFNTSRGLGLLVSGHL